MMKCTVNIVGTGYELPRHDISEVPASLLDSIGYAEFEGSSTLKQTQYHNGKWTDHRKRPFDPQPIAWYSLAGMVRCG